MASLHIKNFGPILDSTKIELTPLMVLIGRQSSGKSTFMKVLCFCRWVEKKIMVSTDDIVSQYTHYNRFIKDLKSFHRLNDEYFRADTELKYDGDVICIEYTGINGNAKIVRKKSFAEKRYNSKLCYIPAERNLVSAIQNVDKTYKATGRDVLFNFIYEWDEAKEPYTNEHPFKLAATGGFSYVNKFGADMLVREDGSETPAFYASSGMQSVMPMDVMANYITDCVGKNASLSMRERNEISETDNDDYADRRLFYQSAQLFIEEPEQNLYPESQKLVVMSIVRSLKKALENGSEQSLALVTTHSPYIMSVVNVLLLAAIVTEKGLKQEVVDGDSVLPSSSISGFFIDEKGIFQDILDAEVPMLSGNDLDGVSDWVDDSISKLNEVLFAAE
ncbi:AAA family ATPase [Bacteroides gallinaceum]|uniref:AAA family ATPase n=1 Tax=Bacteroides gallinaceum TaxID=1462571 RepID=UPI0025AAC41E|nr:AAA family ATPase [Bacteroides gallinaceum]MDN0066758.1 AAA family ATPase [Bacteroides gallinaceum]